MTEDRTKCSSLFKVSIINRMPVAVCEFSQFTSKILFMTRCPTFKMYSMTKSEDFSSFSNGKIGQSGVALF